jgi:murein L,D-transpeptidase YcbB/YkuD
MRRLALTRTIAPAMAVSVVIAIGGCRSAAAERKLHAALQHTLAGPPVPPAHAEVWPDVQTFYALRDGQPAWVKPRSPSRRALAALHLIRRAGDHGLVANDYGEVELAQLTEELERERRNARDLQTRLASLDVRLTAAVLAVGRDVALGRIDPKAMNLPWTKRRATPEFAAILHETIRFDPGSWLDRIEPPHPEYAALRRVLIDLRDELEQPDPGSPASVPAGLPVEHRMRLVELNLERWRWMPDDLGDRHFIVNIPSFHLFAREQGRTVLDMRVVVGKPGTETPVFSDEMETVVFSPYWNIPDTIAIGETAPAAIRDQAYLARNNIEVLAVSGGTTRRVDPSAIDWSDPAQLEGLAFRQRPGASNALGHVKFLFPNRYNVYLHDTPADSLFNRTSRAFSHGCVRVERPEDLARYVLRGRDEWDAARIKRAMHSGQEAHVRLKEEIPVHLVYFTVWVDDSGGVQFLPDPYKYDRSARVPD